MKYLHQRTKRAFTFFGLTLESPTFFEVSVEYFGIFERFFSTSCLFHFGVTLEFSIYVPSRGHMVRSFDHAS